MRASVAWVRDGRVYLTSPDSSGLAEGDRLTFIDRGRTIATGEVARVYDRDLAIAKLKAGSLQKAKHLDRLRILAEPAPLPDLRMMRIGYPARERARLVFPCERMTIRPPMLGDTIRVEASGEHSYQLVRDAIRPGSTPWPDTLLVRLFDDAADEEISLERGELDVAVFWPGELSAHARASPRWHGSGFGLRARGVVAASWTGPDASGVPDVSSADSLELASFNQAIFRGDLAPWPGEAARRLKASGTGAPSPGARSKWWPRPARFVVDPAIPGQRMIERFLNHDRASPAPGESRTVRLVYLDAPIAVADSLARDDPQVSIVFALRCPIVCAGALRPYVEAMGGDVLLNLVSCESAGHRP